MDRDVLDFAFQFPWYTTMDGIDGRGKEMHFWNVYAIWKMGLGRPNIRLGQFVVPFGNLATYETHTRLLQSLYPQSLGIRIDRGASLEGLAGDYDYWLAVVGGNGARADNGAGATVVGRLARRFDLETGIVTAGVSSLRGRRMPRFSVLVDPVMDESDTAMEGDDMAPSQLDFTDKSRLGLDAEIAIGRHLWRTELIAGRDDDDWVNGQFLQWEFALAESLDLGLQAARWEQPEGRQIRAGGSVTYRARKNTTLRLALERRFGLADASNNDATMASLQLELSIPRMYEK